MSKVIGITASIACGKSTVSDYLIQLGYQVVDADLITHQAYLPGTKCYNEIIHHFDCLNDNQIDRQKLGKIVFNNSAKKQLLENIVHPYVINKMKYEVSICHDDIIFLDIPLLYEAHLEYLCDKIIVVYVNENIQLQRLMKRNHINEKQAHKLICSQISIEEKKQKADYIIDNNQGLDELYRNIENLLKEIKKDVLCK